MATDPRKFYGIMKSKKNIKSTLPITMSFNEIEMFDEQITDLYRECVSVKHNKLWQEYENNFTIDEVINAINHLDIAKDVGPMGIAVNFIKYKIDITAPILLNIYNSIMSIGIFPRSWKTSFITPIPKN